MDGQGQIKRFNCQYLAQSGQNGHNRVAFCFSPAANVLLSTRAKRTAIENQFKSNGGGGGGVGEGREGACLCAAAV